MENLLAAALLLSLIPGALAAEKPRPGHALVVPMPRPTPAYRRAFSRLGAQPRKIDRFDEIILSHSQKNRLNPRLVKSIMAAESEFTSACVSPRGARGLMQVMPATAEEMGTARRDLADPESNIRAGTAYLNLLYRTAWRKYRLDGVNYRDGPLWVQQRVIAAYYGGPRYLSGPWPRQARAYVRKVMLFYQSPLTGLSPRSQNDYNGLSFMRT